MKASVKVATPEQSQDDLLAILVPNLGRKVPSSLTELDRLVGGEIERVRAHGDFVGDRDQTALMYPASGPNRVVLVGLGEKTEIAAGGLRRGMAIAAQKAVELGAGTVACFAEPTAAAGCDADTLGRVLVEGAGQGSWHFDDLRAESLVRGSLRRLTVLTDKKSRPAVARGARIGEAHAAGHSLARHLQMLPGNHCTPSHLAKTARKIGRRHGIQVSVLGERQLRTEGMNALLAVAQGSAEAPRLVTLQYRGAGKRPPICLVGKGVTFDAGGISLKPPAHMEEMKFDMSGAAAVLGVFEVLGRLKPKVNVVGLVPATENLPSGTAIKPGDVVKTHFGKTVEIINTDAEGRLILCDALSYARRFKPECILDAATLTGAIVIGLGHVATGVMGNQDSLVDEVRAAGDAAGERCWPLPLWDDYRDQLKSDIADIKNVGGRPAGSITAGWFLKEFVEADTPWAHLDIAGTSYTEGSPGLAKGPSGVGVRLFSQFIAGRAAG